MSPDNLWPAISPLLQARYLDSRRAWIEANADIITPWPRRRTSKRKPLPGVIDASEQEG